MTLIDIITCCGARVCNGTEFQWHCYGENARWLDFADVVGNEYCQVVHDTKTYAVYQITMNVPGQDQAFIWVSPEHEPAYLNECNSRGFGPYDAWDQVKYVPLDKETILQYAKDIGELYYDDLPVPEEI